jgi:hypothetical protein
MSGLLCAIMFVSGAAALLFETLWFRQAGLAFGNSVWASSLVLTSFMAGLALAARRLGRRDREFAAWLSQTFGFEIPMRSGRARVPIR